MPSGKHSQSGDPLAEAARKRQTFPALSCPGTWCCWPGRAAGCSCRIPRASEIPLLPSDTLSTSLEQHQRQKGGEAEDSTRQPRLNCRAGSEEKKRISAAKQIWAGLAEDLPGANPAVPALLFGRGLHMHGSSSFVGCPSLQTLFRF